MKLALLSEEVRLKCLRMLLRPLARYCLRHAHSFQEFTAEAKKVFVEASVEEIKKTGKRVNASKISAMTGLHRRDTKIEETDETEEGARDTSRGIITRVVGVWQSSERFTTSAGKPRVLTYKGDDSDFEELVKQVSSHLKRGTVLFELQRIGMVEETPRGLKLLRSLPGTIRDPMDGFSLVSKDINTLIEAAEFNMLGDVSISNLHIRTEFDNIYVKDIEKAKRWLLKEGKAFHKRARAFFGKIDKDISEDPKRLEEAGGGRVVLGAFGLAQGVSESEGMSEN